MGRHHADHCIIKVDIVCQGVGVQRDPVFAILGGIGQDGIPAPVGAYPGLVFHLHAAGAGGFHQHHGIVQRLAQGDAVGVRQHAAADPVVELFKAVAAAVADVGVAVAAAVVERGIACAPVVAVAAAGIAGLHAIAEVVVIQQGAVQARQIGHAAIEIVRQAVAGAGVPPD